MTTITRRCGTEAAPQIKRRRNPIDKSRRPWHFAHADAKASILKRVLVLQNEFTCRALCGKEKAPTWPGLCKWNKVSLVFTAIRSQYLAPRLSAADHT
jgi:hypothetical protein